MGAIIKKYMFAIILLFIIGIVWAALLFFFDSKESGSKIDVSIYSNQLNKSFDEKNLDETYNRVVKTLPISPKEFINLKKKD